MAFWRLEMGFIVSSYILNEKLRHKPEPNVHGYLYSGSTIRMSS